MSEVDPGLLAHTGWEGDGRTQGAVGWVRRSGVTQASRDRRC
jgi:hypothetical protein